MKNNPIVENACFLEDAGITFIIRAAEKLGETEKRQAAGGYTYSAPKSERPVRGDTVTIGTKVTSPEDEPEELLIRYSKRPRE